MASTRKHVSTVPGVGRQDHCESQHRPPTGHASPPQPSPLQDAPGFGHGPYGLSSAALPSADKANDVSPLPFATNPARPSAFTSSAPSPQDALQARFRPKSESNPTASLGYYSWSPDAPDLRRRSRGMSHEEARTAPSPPPVELNGGPSASGEVFIPPAPRLPQLEWGPLSETERRELSAPPTLRDSRPYAARASSAHATERMVSTMPPPARRPIGHVEAAVAGSLSSPGQPTTAAHAQPSSRRSNRPKTSQAPPRIYFSPHVRRQAEMWSESGSLSLPGCSSPRHARAVQRALLLALLTEPGYDLLPQGLCQRVGWLFAQGWESGSEGHNLRELDDLATVLSLPPGRESRELLVMAVEAVLPHPLPAARPPSSRRSVPPSRGATRGTRGSA